MRLRHALPTLTALVAAGALAVLPARAEAPDFPGDQIRNETFKLSPEQDAEVQQRRIFRPTPEQLARLRAIEPTCPQLLAVITARSNECKGELTGTVVWSHPGEIELAGGRLSPWSREQMEAMRIAASQDDTAAAALLAGRGEEHEHFMAEYYAAQLHPYPDDLIMDHEGRLFLDGRLMTEAAFDSLVMLRSRPGEILVRLPPVYPGENDAYDIERLLKLSWWFAQKGFQLKIHE